MIWLALPGLTDVTLIYVMIRAGAILRTPDSIRDIGITIGYNPPKL